MSMTLTSGRESRMEGAPPLPDPEKEARARAVAIHLLTQFGEPVTEESLRAIMPDAERMAAQYSTPQFEAQAIEANRAGMDAAVARGTANAADRASQRRAARGVVPEDLPPGEFGVASGREVQEYNRPVEEAEAVLGMEQDVADRITRGLREGRPDWEAEGERQFLQERGEQNPMAAQGDRDMDLRRSIMQQRGQFFEMPDGTMIPVGREPTAADFRNERAWRQWVSENPGSERQARYDPQGYETYREGVREGIRENAQEEMATYGMGVSDPAVREELDIAPLTPAQATARNRRDRSEDRVREAQRGRFYAQRLQNDTGMPAGTDIAAMEAERFRQRDAARKDDLAQRRAARRSQGMLLAPGGRGVVNAINELPDEWRHIAILDRLTNGRVGGPTPLGVEAVGAQNALRFINNEAMGGNDPLRRQMMTDQMDMQRRQNSPAIAGQKDIADGNAQTPEAVQHLKDLAERHDTTTGGFSYEDEMNLANTLQDPPYNMSQADAEAKAYELAESRRWFSGDKPASQQGVAPPPAAAPAPQAKPPAPDVPTRRAPQGGGRGGPVRNPLPMLPGGVGRGGSGTLPRDRR